MKVAIKTAYVSKLGDDYKISTNFTLREMQCNDGSDKVIYSAELLEMLEKLRSYGGFSITINSGYRTAAYNKKIGGASASQHIKGTAADIVVKKDGAVVDAKKICCLAQTLGFRGIGYISAKAVHLDMRESGSYRGDERSNYSSNVGNDFYSYFSISKAQIAALKAAAATTNTLGTEDDDMTEQEVRDIIAKVEAEKKESAASNWSLDARTWAEANGIITGDENKNMMYKLTCTREMVITFLYRFWKLIKG